MLIAFPLAGAATGRWWSLLLPAVGWPLFYAGLNQGWWGSGTGDGWQYAALGVGLFGVATTGAATAARRGLRGRGS